MAKYKYPAIFTLNELGGYCVNFPDIQGGYADGKDLTEARERAKSVLSLMLYTYETEGIKILPPAKKNEIKAPKGAIVEIISCNIDDYRESFNTGRAKAVAKEAAEERITKHFKRNTYRVVKSKQISSAKFKSFKSGAKNKRQAQR
ncbi:MAG: type II toxin-antitoxin system HicB family antitoxin [Oscillospiraceae bacterium]|nr:type II toxin-antitoxin system HicB family antitoxin [Oscillospiraceae bacterium]